MKQGKSKQSRSIAATCAVLFVLYSLVFTLLLVALGYFINVRMTEMFPSMSDVLEYEDELERDEFEKIPLRRFQGCDIVVLDGEYNVVYTSSKKVARYLKKKDIDFINDFYTDKWYSLSEYKNEAGEVYTLVFHYTYDEATELGQFTEYCVLDEDRNIVEGTLFDDKEKLSEDEFDLLCGSYRKRKTIERYSYVNVDGEARTLIFFAQLFDYGQYEKKAAETDRLWLVAVPVVMVLIGLLVFFFVRKIYRSIKPLDDAIVRYGEGKRANLEEMQIPREFRRVVDNFDRLLERLEESKQETERAYQDRQRILADISHDIRTPLTVIQGYTRALNDGIVPEEKQRQYIRVIYDRTEAMAELTESLLEYTKMEHPDYQLALERADLCEYCRTYLADKYEEIQLRRFQLEADIPEEAVEASFDRKLLKRVFENLINNAMKSNPTGATLAFRLRREGEGVVITVADNGRGIPKEIRDSLFEPFVSGNHARTASGGTGLGLSIAKKIIELHGGAISLAEQPEEGYSVEFIIRLPAGA